MKEIVPTIGMPTIFGVKTKTRARKKRVITWEELLGNVTTFPTLIIPVLPTGEATHAFCVVDDLIFDSSTPFALKLCLDSVKWICNNTLPEIYRVFRFDSKVSPPGRRVFDVYKRSIVYHWNHPARKHG